MKKTKIIGWSDLQKAEEDKPTLENLLFCFNKLVDDYKNFTKGLSIQANFDGFIAEDVVIPSLTKVKIQHFLGIKPKWRMILRQVGNGVLTDIPEDWDNKVIALYNNGAVDVTATIFIAKE